MLTTSLVTPWLLLLFPLSDVIKRQNPAKKSPGSIRGFYINKIILAIVHYSPAPGSKVQVRISCDAQPYSGLVEAVNPT